MNWRTAATLGLLFLAAANAIAQDDSNRLPCRDAVCRQVRAFVKSHYCGKSPGGNGPDDSCEPRYPAQPALGVVVRARVHCDWDDHEGVSTCRQIGQPSDAERNALLAELHRLGLPSDANGEIDYTVFERDSAGAAVAQAMYQRVSGTELEICEVIAAIDLVGHAMVLRELKFQKTDVDVPKVTTWGLMDWAPAEGPISRDVILEGDAYEDHWIEVVGLRGGRPQTIFSGLGYHL